MAKSSLIGRIAVDLVANTGKLLAPLKKAEKSISSFVARVNGFTSVMAKVAAPITALVGGFLTVSYAVNKLKQAFSDIESIGLAADRFGTTTERLIDLQHAAKMANVETEALHNALFQMLKRGYGLNQLEAMADEFANIESPVARTAFIVKRFGKAGQVMADILKDGSEGLREAAREAKRLGLELSRVDAAKIEIAGDNLDKMKEMLDAIWRRLAISIVPLLQWVSEEFINIGAQGEQMGRRLDMVFERMMIGLGKVLDYFHDLRIILKAIELEWVMVTPPFTDVEAVRKAYKEFEKALISKTPSERIQEFRNELNRLSKDFQRDLQRRAPQFDEGESMDMRRGAPLLEPRSQELFKAILGTQPGTIEQQQLETQRRQLAVLERLERRDMVFLSPNLAGGL